VLEQKGATELPRQVVILTDGEVTNTDAVIGLAGANASTARIFTFGIGAGASHHLVRGLARAGGGTAEFIYPGERIEPKVLRQLARLLSPALTEVCVEWVGGSVTQAPIKIPPVFAGGRLLVYGFVKGHRPTNVRLRAAAPSGPLSFDVAVPEAAVGTGRTVATLAARARIRELEGGSDWLSARGSQQKDRKASSARNEIIALSLRYGLMSRETSFVAIERRDTPVTGDVKLRKVPIALTTGWGGRQQTLRLAGGLYGASARYLSDEAAPAMLRAQAPGSAGRFARMFIRPGSSLAKQGSVPTNTQDLSRLFRAEAPPMRRPSGTGGLTGAARSGMHRLILLQTAEGSWDLTEELAAVVGRDLVELRAAVQVAKGSQQEISRAWATALALAWLGRNATEAEDEWHLLALKARTWLDKTAAVPASGSTWIQAANQFLGV
jgi:Ca-activated chloride channel family protein